MVGRKRIPLTGGGPRVELAQRMRDLRDAGGLSLRALAEKSGYSQAALSAAESGRRVPSWPLVEAYLQSCGEDPERWRQLWEVARAEAPANGVPEDVTGVPEDVTDAAGFEPGLGDVASVAPPRRPLAGRLITLGGLAWFTVGVLAGSAITYMASRPAAMRQPSMPSVHQLPPAGSIRVHDGADPYASGCKPDRKAIDWETVVNPEGKRFGVLILFYSRVCDAEWGYVDGPNAPAWTVHIVAYRPNDGGAAPSSFSGTAPPGSWGNILSIRAGCVQIEAWVTDKHGSGLHVRTLCMQGG